MTAALRAAKRDFESKADILRKKIDRAQKVIRGSESRLVRLSQAFDKRVREITRDYVNLPEQTSTEHSRSQRRAPKLSLDQPVLSLIHAMPSPIVAVPEVVENWNREHPDSEIGRTTIRGILDRLASDGHLQIVENGRPGRAKVRQYRLVSSSIAEPEEAEAVAG